MTTLAGPFASVSAVLALGGLLKALRPGPTAGALSAMGLPGRQPLVRLFGLAEVAVGVSALVSPHRLPAGLVAASYLAFAVFVLAALRRRLPVSSCGCFGRPDTPPTVTHVVVNLGAAVVAAAVAVDPGWSVVSIAADQPLAGVPFLVLSAVTAGFMYLALALLPQTLAAARTPA